MKWPVTIVFYCVISTAALAAGDGAYNGIATSIDSSCSSNNTVNLTVQGKTVTYHRPSTNEDLTGTLADDGSFQIDQHRSVPGGHSVKLTIKGQVTEGKVTGTIEVASPSSGTCTSDFVAQRQ